MGLHTKLKTTMVIICAAFTLHNIAVEFKDSLPTPDDDNNDDDNISVQNYAGTNNFGKRNATMNTYF